jgi:proline iminopeptidase
MDPDGNVHLAAARAWCHWEDAVIARGADEKAPPQPSEPFQLAFTRIVTHFWCHNAWLEEAALLKNAHRLSDIPGVMIHGRLDLGCPLVIPYRLSEAWPGSKLRIIDDAGHDACHPGMTEATVSALDGFAA